MNNTDPPTGRSQAARDNRRSLLVILASVIMLLCVAVFGILWAPERLAAKLMLTTCGVCALVLSVGPVMVLLLNANSRWKALVALGLGVVLAAIIAETSATMYFAGDRSGLESMRRRMTGQELPPGPYIGLPYLVYAPRPGSFDDGNLHNHQGFRGDPVPLVPAQGTSRVLCLGGSTTYGYGVARPEDAYPAQLKQLLEANLPEGVETVEVINAGLPHGTSAELLTHYHFKYHYFRPDLVIINTGGNDAGLTDPTEADALAKYYQPDYSHWHRPLQLPQPLSPLGRTMVKSRFVAWLVTLATYGPTPRQAPLTRPEGLPPPIAWHPAAQQPGLVSSLADSELAFTHNLNALVSLCQADGAQVLLVPFRLAPGYEAKPSAAADLRLERILKNLARSRDVALAPFPASVISPENWLQNDDCHLNAEGCREKAAYLATFARQLLWGRGDRDHEGASTMAGEGISLNGNAQ